MVYHCVHGQRVAKPLNSSRVSATRLSCRRLNTAALPAVKLVINANARDRQPLRQLPYSLLSVGHYLWDDTIVVLGGGAADIPPARQLVSSFAGVSADSVHSSTTKPATLVVIQTAYHSYDYHAFDALWRYRHDSLVAGQGFVYTMDTTLAHPGFPRRLLELGKNIFRHSESKRCSIQVLSVPLPNANLCAFGVGVLLNYGTNFRLPNLTKREAVDIEKGCAGSRAKPIVDFGALIEQHPRKSCGYHDVYATRRSPRLCWYYDGLNLLKFHDSRT